jgi:hypothetical protein
MGHITRPHLHEILPQKSLVCFALEQNPNLYPALEASSLINSSTQPKGDAEVLASGWKAHYWEPIEKLLE